ncbi:MAG: efflux RND transporter periplasmic adaptor subunit [Verrucomicrobia bacterium]|nr:efflux RND transporter periplasmic adaptor subunit [Verrucomicrobiota bacterium]
MLLMLLVMAAIIAGLAYIKYQSIQAGIAMGAKFAPPPTPVTTIVVKGQTWQPVLSAVGSLRAVNGVTVSTDLAGIVSEISFESGRQVKKGDLLVTLDTKQEEAQLRSAEARLNLSKTDLDRKRDLVERKAVSQSDFDSAESQVQQMKASVDEMKAIIARKHIAAPFDGAVGIRQVNLGQYLNPGAPVVPLQSIDPIYVEFSVPQQHINDVAVGKKIRLVPTKLVDADFTGEITAVDSVIDVATRNITAQATIKNPDHKLRAGMFVSVEVLLPEQKNVLAIPSSAIAYAPYGDSVYVLRDGKSPDGKALKQVEQIFVKLGPQRGDQVAVLSGLKEGDEIVSSGVFKMRPGAPVTVNNSVQPGNELNPKPADT